MARYFKTDPVALANGTYVTNLLYPGTRDGTARAAVGWLPLGDPVLIVTKIKVVNTTTGALTFRLHQNTTGAAAAAANALFWDKSVAPGDVFVEFGEWRLDGSDVSDYLIGGGSATGLTIAFEGEVIIGG
jgi:hypothetical protein